MGVGEGTRQIPQASVLFGLMIVAVFLAFVQIQVHRLSFFFKYEIQPKLSRVRSPTVHAYFESTHFAKINWDHTRVSRPVVQAALLCRSAARVIDNGFGPMGGESEKACVPKQPLVVSYN